MPRLGNGRLSGLVGLVLGLWLVAGVPGRADAALLVINDGADVWSLDVQTGCTTCDIVLQVEWGDPSARAGTLLQGVQWQLDGVTITDHGYVSFDPGSDDWWDFGFGVISATGCSGGGSGSACSEWEGPGDGLTVVSGQTWTWTFETVFASALPSTLSGTIRAGFDQAAGDQDRIFSPGTFTFNDDGIIVDDDEIVPEPASLLLLSGGLGAAAYAARRRRRTLAVA
jgi:hypothetical protein